ncbi:MAG: hypothetical protein O7H39_08755, partial [Gammaproteobacteria bacterium]|nr:hypothetical protein [Gammaproteobacteria bacterium]
MSTTIISIHGHGPKPGQQALEGFWKETLTHGFGRFQEDKLETLNSLPHEFVYFGDLTTEFLTERGETYDSELDLRDRRGALDALKARRRKTFYSRGVYERLPGHSALGELVADLGLPLLQRLGLSRRLIKRFAPDYIGYMDDTNGMRGRAIERLISALREPVERGDKIVLVAHCMGSVIAFDALWELSHAPTVDWYHGQKIDFFLTLGSPLGDETIKQNLYGATHDEAMRYPTNIVKWVNITAEDDYISHDNTV